VQAIVPNDPSKKEGDGAKCNLYSDSIRNIGISGDVNYHNILKIKILETYNNFSYIPWLKEKIVGFDVVSERKER
jgi:hypothetical protein